MKSTVDESKGARLPGPSCKRSHCRHACAAQRRAAPVVHVQALFLNIPVPGWEPTATALVRPGENGMHLGHLFLVSEHREECGLCLIPVLNFTGTRW